MAKAPRTLTQVLDSFRKTHRDVDPSIDISKGPISVWTYTMASEVARSEQQTSYLSSVYQLDIADSLDRDVLINLGRNFGLEINTGKQATVTVTVYRTSRPQAGVTYIFYAGSLVSTSDGRYIFTTQNDVIMNGDNADVYFNATTQRYELNARAVSVAAGSDYNVAAGTITKFVTDTNSFEGVTNYDAAFSGRDPLDNLTFRNQIWLTMQGMDRSANGVMLTLLYDVDPTGFEDVRLIPSSDYLTFARQAFLTGKAGYDIYMITDSYVDDVQSGIANGGETEILLNRRPAFSVDRILVDGYSAPFSFSADTNPAWRGSPKSNDRVVLATPLLPAQAYEIHYYYYDMIYNAQNQFTSFNTIFGCDVLTRRADPVQIFIAGKLSTTSISNKQDVIDSIRTAAVAFLSNPYGKSANSSRSFLTTLDPYDFQQYVIGNINGISGFTLTHFNRMDKAVMDLEVIELNGKTEFPVLSPSFTVT